MLEQFANRAVSTLAVGINAVATTLTLQSAASFPTQGQFRLYCEGELMLATTVSGNTFTVVRGVEGTKAATHMAGVAATQIVTTASLESLRADYYNTAWYALTDVYWDPVSGSDANSGATALAAVQTFAEIVRRYGTLFPIFSHSVTIHQLSSQAPGVDPVVFRPVLLAGVTFALVGSPAAVATFTLGAVTAKNRSTPQLLQAAGFSAAGLAANQQVINTTRGGSKSWIQSINSGTATLSQPMTPLTPANGSNFPANLGSEVDTWTSGDSVTIYAMPTINLVALEARGGQVNTSLQGGIWWLQNVHVLDPAGAPGSSFVACQAIDAVPWYVDCVFDPYVDLVGVDANGVDGAFSVNCVWNGSGQIQCGTFAAGICNLFNLIVGYFGCVDYDAMCMAPGGSFACPDDSAFVGAVYIAASVTAYGNGIVKIDPVWIGSSFIWGPGGIQIIDSATVQNKTGTTWVATLLCKGGFNISGNTTATKYVPGTPGVFTDGIAITPANLDAFDGLQNLRTGAKFSGAS